MCVLPVFPAPNVDVVYNYVKGERLKSVLKPGVNSTPTQQLWKWGKVVHFELVTTTTLQLLFAAVVQFRVQTVRNADCS